MQVFFRNCAQELRGKSLRYVSRQNSKLGNLLNLQKKSEIVGEFFLQLWKSDFDDFLQITGDICI